MLFKEIINETTKVEEPINAILKELYKENLAIDLDGKDLEAVLNIEINTDIISEIKTLIATKHKIWDYFDVMKILGM